MNHPAHPAPEGAKPFDRLEWREAPECRRCHIPMGLNAGCEWPDDDRALLCSSCMTRRFEELLAATDSHAALRAENDQMRVALECGQQNCDDTYNDLRAERDSARQAKTVALAECDKLRARCERLEGALARVDVEVRQSKATLYIDGVKICALPTHLDGNPAESEKLIEWAGIARALAQPEDGK